MIKVQSEIFAIALYLRRRNCNFIYIYIYIIYLYIYYGHQIQTQQTWSIALFLNVIYYYIGGANHNLHLDIWYIIFTVKCCKVPILFHTNTRQMRAHNTWFIFFSFLSFFQCSHSTILHMFDKYMAFLLSFWLVNSMACFLALFNPPGTCIINFTCDFGDNKNKIIQVHIFDNILNRGRGEHGINLVRKWK